MALPTWLQGTETLPTMPSMTILLEIQKLSQNGWEIVHIGPFGAQFRRRRHPAWFGLLLGGLALAVGLGSLATGATGAATAAAAVGILSLLMTFADLQRRPYDLYYIPPAHLV